MARRNQTQTSQNKRRSTKNSRSGGRSSSVVEKVIPVEAISRTDYGKALKEFSSMPAVRYLAGGIAGALIVRFVSNASGGNISNFFRTNYDNLGGKLRDFTSNLRGSEETEIRH